MLSVEGSNGCISHNVDIESVKKLANRVFLSYCGNSYSIFSSVETSFDLPILFASFFTDSISTL